MRDVLVDEAQAARHVQKDVAQSVLPDDPSLEIAELRRLLLLDLHDGARLRRDRRLDADRRLHQRFALKQRRELRRPARAGVITRGGKQC